MKSPPASASFSRRPPLRFEPDAAVFAKGMGTVTDPGDHRQDDTCSRRIVVFFFHLQPPPPPPKPPPPQKNPPPPPRRETPLLDRRLGPPLHRVHCAKFGRGDLQTSAHIWTIFRRRVRPPRSNTNFRAAHHRPPCRRISRSIIPNERVETLLTDARLTRGYLLAAAVLPTFAHQIITCKTFLAAATPLHGIGPRHPRRRYRRQGKESRPLSSGGFRAPCA